MSMTQLLFCMDPPLVVRRCLVRLLMLQPLLYAGLPAHLQQHTRLVTIHTHTDITVPNLCIRIYSDTCLSTLK